MISKISFRDYWQFKKNNGESYKDILNDVALEIIRISSEKGDLKKDLEVCLKISEWNVDQYFDLVKQYESKEEKDKTRTDERIVKLIQVIAPLIKPTGPFIDWTLGLGTILIGMGNNIFGYDIDEKLNNIAKAILLLNSCNIENINKANSLIDQVNNNGIIIFDPPLNLKSDPNFFYNTEESKRELYKKMKSEYNFIYRFIDYASQDSFFIGILLPSFLKSSGIILDIRRSLIENNLISIFNFNLNLLVVVGTKDIKNYPCISVFNILEDFDLSEFFNNIGHLTNFQDFLNNLTDVVPSNVIKREDLLKSKNFEIEIPYINKIKQSDDFITIRKNLYDKLKIIRKNKDNLENILIKYFGVIPNTSDCISLPENLFSLSESINLTIFSKNYLIEIDKKYYLNKEQLYYDKIDHVTMSEIFSDLKKIYIGENFEYYILPEKFSENIKNAISILSDKEKDIYNNLIQYWLFDDINSNFLEKTNVSNSDIVRSLKLFKDLGLVFRTQYQDLFDKSIIEFYDSHRIFHPLIDGR